MRTKTAQQKQATTRAIRWGQHAPHRVRSPARRALPCRHLIVVKGARDLAVGITAGAELVHPLAGV